MPLQLTMCPTTRTMHVWPCCRQFLDPEQQKADAARAQLFGAEAYALCPKCFQQVSPEFQTPRYRRRCAVLMKRAGAPTRTP
jgi:hypothetical protein